MGKCKDLTATEKQDIVKNLKDDMSKLQISKKLKRYHRTIKKTAENIHHNRVRSKGKGFKDITVRNKRQLKRILSNHPLLTSAAVFDKPCFTNIKRDKRCRIRQTLGNVTRSSRGPPLTQIHKGERLHCAQDHMKIDFSEEIFTDESRVTLDGPDGWSKGWILDDTRKAPTTKRRHQDGDGIMIWAGTVGNKLTGRNISQQERNISQQVNAVASSKPGP